MHKRQLMLSYHHVREALVQQGSIYACFVIGKIKTCWIFSIKTLGPQGSLAIDQSTIILERKRRAEAEVLHNSEYT